MNNYIKNNIFNCQYCQVTHDGQMIELDNESSFKCMKCSEQNFVGQCLSCGDFLITKDKVNYSACSDCDETAIFEPSKFVDPKTIEKEFDYFNNNYLHKLGVPSWLQWTITFLFIAFWFNDFEIPKFNIFGPKGEFKNIIGPKLRDPGSMEIRSYSGPYIGKIFVPTSGNKGIAGELPSGCSNYETYTVELSARNGFGGTAVSNWFVIMNDGEACDAFPESNLSGWGTISTPKMFGIWAPGCDCD
tara:strand:+ start:57 stop:791 length:735 start_codon:yes stop_codon:yes gene_type:complete